MYFYTFQFLLLSCVLQFLDAAPPSTGNLPFEVDMDSGNTGIDTGLDNKLTEQASKQGENFVDSPKPAEITQDFSFNSQPETPSSKTKTKPTKTASATTNSSQNPTSVSDTSSASAPTVTTGVKQKRKPNSELSPSSTIPSMNVGATSMLRDPFFAYAWREFMRQQQMIMSLLSSDLMGMNMPPDTELEMMNPMFPFGGSSFPMTTMPEMEQLFDMNNMELVEDRVVDDTNGKGRVQTYKSKDGTAIVQTQTSYSNGIIPTLSGEQIKTGSTAKSNRLRSSRTASPTKLHSTRRVRAH